MKYIHAEGDTTQKQKIMYDDPLKDQMISHRRRYYNETENNTLP